MSQRRPVHAVRFEDVEAFHHHGGGAGGVPGDMVLDLDLVVPWAGLVRMRRGPGVGGARPHWWLTVPVPSVVMSTVKVVL
jgi:hypothetical protein